MACAALKRPHNFDLLAGSPTESLTGASPKRRRCGAIISNTGNNPNVSAFLEATPRYCRDELSRNVHDEWRRLQRRRRLACPSSPPNNTSNMHTTTLPTSNQSSFWSSSLQTTVTSPPKGSMSPGSMSPTRGKDQPTFTVKQVVSLCERLWKEREEKLREDYDQVLNERLTDQYDSFLKFTQDQIMRKYQQSSCSSVNVRLIVEFHRTGVLPKDDDVNVQIFIGVVFNMKILVPKQDQAFLPDPSLIFRPEQILDGVKEFRNYEDNLQTETVRKTYREMHINQTVDFVKEKHKKWLNFNHANMTIMDAIMMLDNLVDESDPDIDLPNSIHAFQTAERIREKYPNEDWFQLAGLVHDLGKVLALWGEPQWCVVGDTFPVGCQFQNTCVFPEYFAENLDYNNPLYNTENGIYEPKCGLDNVTMSWGHDDYLYHVLKNHPCCKLPDVAYYVIRFHSFYPYHTNGSYQHLCNAKDEEMLYWLKEFNSFDLYSKSEIVPDVEELKPYYQTLIDKYIPGEMCW